MSTNNNNNNRRALAEHQYTNYPVAQFNKLEHIKQYDLRVKSHELTIARVKMQVSNSVS